MITPDLELTQRLSTMLQPHWFRNLYLEADTAKINIRMRDCRGNNWIFSSYDLETCHFALQAGFCNVVESHKKCSGLDVFHLEHHAHVPPVQDDRDYRRYTMPPMYVRGSTNLGQLRGLKPPNYMAFVLRQYPTHATLWGIDSHLEVWSLMKFQVDGISRLCDIGGDWYKVHYKDYMNILPLLIAEPLRQRDYHLYDDPFERDDKFEYDQFTKPYEQLLKEYKLLKDKDENDKDENKEEGDGEQLALALDEINDEVDTIMKELDDIQKWLTA